MWVRTGDSPHRLVTHTPDSPTYRKAGLEVSKAERDRYGDFRGTEEVFEAWTRTLEIAEILEAPVMVFQCPASFTPTEEHKENMRVFFREAQRGDLSFAWEPRGDWEDGEIETLCRDLDLIHCVDPFTRQPVSEGVAYFRLHGVGGYSYTYNDEDLEELHGWCQPFEEVYVLFNNASMWEDGLRFKQMLSSG